MEVEILPKIGEAISLKSRKRSGCNLSEQYRNFCTVRTGKLINYQALELTCRNIIKHPKARSHQIANAQLVLNKIINKEYVTFSHNHLIKKISRDLI